MRTIRVRRSEEHGGGSRAGRLARRLRGWGGVSAMAAACALTAAAVLLPLAHAAPEAGTGTAVHEPASIAAPPQAPWVLSDTCQDPDASLRPSAVDGPTIERIRSAGKLVAGVDQNSFKWGYRNPDGRLDGFDIALVKAIAKDILGDENKVIYRAIPTSQRIPALQDGRVDIVVRTMTINCKRLEEVAFSTAYFEAGQQVLAPKGSPITGYDASLKGRKVCVAAGSTAEAALTAQSYGSVPVTVPNQLDCLVRLQLGEVDGIITDNALAAGQAAQDPSIQLVGSPFTKELYGVAMKKDASDLVRRVNKVLENYRAGGNDSPWMNAYRAHFKGVLPEAVVPPEPKYRDG
ncbi:MULTISPECIES: glutamate ABC transporter substrate-binding protein [unclassified Streptomyces]|uniref:glutamate ABC transporter substrate-binding protein n=1 Tax=unclassified Streptomyces TaxID=2593676 RepID=UPI001BED0815|nr:MULTISPECIES: glutamate ABC transporter substrate-binding protein [unclassified Streptomyces]MBT2404862.1 glutamate ABC transporter substrate-binding protein [Streptomyces sp. ISL-21]MBT2458499.1 glutamate ABC transporter substrate-binding protein [Streptomyces sp. ISL-86]